MNRINHRRLIVGLFFYVAGLLSIPSPVHAEDTDIFSINSAISGQRPNVLIILDSSANWSSTDTIAGGSKYTHVSAALASTIGNLTDQFNVGLMMYSETGGGNDNIDGGTMRAGVRQMTAANRTMLVNFFNSVDGGFDKSNNTAMGMAFYEAYLYFKSANAYSGFGKVKRDYHLNTWPTSGSQAGAPIAMQNANNTLWASSGNALSTSSSAAYNGPITDACQKNFIIYIANGNVTDPNSSNADATSFLAAAGGDTSPVPMNQNDGNQGNISDEWTRFLASADISGLAGKQTVVTYTVEVNPVADNQGLDNTQLLVSMAEQGKGSYFGVTSAGGGAAIADALNQIFAEILAENSVFAAATLPVNVAVRGFFLNQVYMGVFRPDANSSPRWPGNVKQYALGLTTSGELFVADKRGARVENASSGFVAPSTQSYWSTASTFWDTTYYPDAAAKPPLTATTSDLPDGEFVEKGGAAQHLRTVHATDVTTRSVYTCVGCAGDTDLSATAATSFVDTNSAITDTMLGISTAQTVSSPVTRSGTTATVSLTGHGFATGQIVQIAGALESAYNGNFNVTVTDANTFTYPIVESPVTPATTTTTMRASKGVSAKSISTITRSAGSTTATVTTTLPHSFTNGSTITITNAGDSTYNGSYVIANAGTAGVSTTFTITVVETPVTPATAVGTASITVSGVTTTKNIKTNPSIGVTRSGSTVTIETSNNHGFATGNQITIAGVVPTDYNGTFSITVPAGSAGNKTFTYTLPTALGPALSSLGGNADAGTTLTVSSITRSGTVATATTATDPAAAGFANGNSITISGADQSQYNGTFTIAAVNAAAKTFTYSPLTLSPGTTATPNPTITATGSGGITKAQLINWVRGANVQLDDNPNVTPTASTTRVRGYLHGDVLHSRPAVVNYNRAGQPANRDLVVYYGANDAMLHAVKGGQNDLDGDHKWTFIPSEFYGKLSRLYLENPKISTSAPRSYFVDGPISVDAIFINDNSTPPVPRIEGTGAKAQLYAGMRRGGRFYYSLDVLDPDHPIYKWKIDSTMTGFSELGQSWSEMRVDKIKIRSSSCPSGLDSDNNCKVLIFGAGYDAAANDSAVQGTATMGRGIFIVDAGTGALIWHASNALSMAMPTGAVYKSVSGMDYAIPADLRSVNVDRDASGSADRIYAADTGGNIWRVNLYVDPTRVSDGSDPNLNPSNWTVGKIAALSGAAAADKRKFLFAPDTVAFDSTTRAILIGSGDREHPFETSINNRFYMIKDEDGMSNLQTTVTENELQDLTANLIQTGTQAQADQQKADLATSKGWMIRLADVNLGSSVPNPRPGEKAVGGVTTLAGSTIFATNTPAASTPGSCTGSLGLALIYAVSIADATSTIDFNGDGVLNSEDLAVKKEGGGFAPSPVPVLAQVPIYETGGSTGNDPNKPTGDTGVGQCALLGPKTICPKGQQPDHRFRTFWNLLIDN